MARFIKKMPNLKFPKYKMDGIEDIEELNVAYTPEMLAEMQKQAAKKRQDYYPGTNYKTIKEVFERSTNLYAERPFIVEKFNRKGSFEEISYGRFRSDVIHLGTGLSRAFKLQDEACLPCSSEKLKESAPPPFPFSLDFKCRFSRIPPHFREPSHALQHGSYS